MADQVQWQLSGDYFENCSCSVVCPCLVSAAPPLTSRPTEGVCNVPAVFHIESGRYGDVALDGLNVAIAVHTPGPIGRWPPISINGLTTNRLRRWARFSPARPVGPWRRSRRSSARTLGSRKSRSHFASKARSVPQRFRAFSTWLSIRCRPCIRAARCGRTPGIRSRPRSWRWLWERPGARSPIMASVGIILARTVTTRGLAGQIRCNIVKQPVGNAAELS